LQQAQGEKGLRDRLSARRSRRVNGDETDPFAKQVRVVTLRIEQRSTGCPFHQTFGLVVQADQWFGVGHLAEDERVAPQIGGHVRTAPRASEALEIDRP
jgi:hypothetical protein